MNNFSAYRIFNEDGKTVSRFVDMTLDELDPGQVVIRTMNYLALSYDHRIVDGRDAVLFLATIKEALEFPGRAALDL